MTDRLTKRELAFYAAQDDLPNLSRLAREVQEWRAMRCDTCEHYVPTPDIVRGFCRSSRMTVLPAWFCADHTPKLQGGAMSARTIESLHPTTWASIQMQGHREQPSLADWDCGCSLVQGKVWLCTHHSGFEDGAWAVEDKEDPDE